MCSMRLTSSMQTEVVLAVAGSGKTTAIAERIAAQPAGSSSLAVTYTLNGQAEIDALVGRPLSIEHETLGWFSFLVRHIVRPYLPKIYPGIVAHSLNFTQSTAEIPRSRSGWGFYLDDSHRPYSSRLALLAKKVLAETDGAPMRRLEKIYTHIYIDEFQDFVGNDLEILRELMKSRSRVYMSGDARQAVLATSRSDRLNRPFAGSEIVNWFRLQEAKGNCTISEANQTRRFNQDIANFSDLIHSPSLHFPATVSAGVPISGHDGVFLVSESDAVEYSKRFSRPPTVLRAQSGARQVPEGEVLTFGSSKGISRDRVLVLTTGPIEKLLSTRSPLAAKSACGFYVAVTRARYSVALIVKDAVRLHDRLHADFEGKVQLWCASDVA